MDFDYFYGRGADQFAIYQIPKILITDEKFAGITMESKILYSLMLDRASLSAKNGWLDEDGKVFIYYKLDRIMADMHCANQKATKMLKELEDKAGLIERQKQGQGKPTKIYVKDFATGLHDYGPDRRIIQTHENHDSETNENHESRNVIITGPDSWKSCTNNTNDPEGTDPEDGNTVELLGVSLAVNFLEFRQHSAENIVTENDVRPVFHVDSGLADGSGGLLYDRNIPAVDDVADGRAIDRKMSSIDVPAADPLTDCKPDLVLAICDNDCVLRAFYGEDFFRNWHFQASFYIVLLYI